MIALIAVVFLASIFPVKGMLRSQEMKTQARTEAGLVVSAIHQYLEKYNKYPLDVSVTGGTTEFYETKTDAKFMAVLTGKDTAANPLGANFFDPSLRGLNVGRLGSEGNLVDPWGREYTVRITANEDKYVGVIPELGEKPLREAVAVWSRGAVADQKDAKAWIRSWD